MAGAVAYRYMSIVYIRLYTCAEFRIGCTNTNYWVQSVGLVKSVYGTGTATPKDGRLVCLNDGDHQGLTTWGVWTGPECVSDRTS